MHSKWHDLLQFFLIKMVSYTVLFSLLPLLAGVNAAAVDKRQSASFSVTGGTKVAIRDAAPVGISYVYSISHGRHLND
jgi:hypothetical protein